MSLSLIHSDRSELDHSDAASELCEEGASIENTESEEEVVDAVEGLYGETGCDVWCFVVVCVEMCCAQCADPAISGSQAI